MDQLSFFSAGVAEPTVEDLGGLLAGPGQFTLGAAGAVEARLSVLLAQQWRAEAIVQEFLRRGIDAESRPADPQEIRSPPEDPEPVAPQDGTPREGTRTGPLYLVRSVPSAVLAPLVGSWTKGSVKQVPTLPTPPGGFLRCWALASGRPDPAGYLLGLDPRAEHVHTRLASALSAAGLTGVLLGSRAGGPAVRIVGRRRLERLAELLGDPPPGAPADAFPPGR